MFHFGFPSVSLSFFSLNGFLSFFSSSFWSSCWSLLLKWLLWYLALSTRARWVTDNVISVTQGLLLIVISIRRYCIIWLSSFSVCLDKRWPRALNEWGLHKVWWTGRWDQSCGLPADSGQCYTLYSFVLFTRTFIVILTFCFACILTAC